MHLDLDSDDRTDQVVRLIGLGAPFARHNVEDGCTVLLDPEGNEFCACTVSRT